MRNSGFRKYIHYMRNSGLDSVILFRLILHFYCICKPIFIFTDLRFLFHLCKSLHHALALLGYVSMLILLVVSLVQGIKYMWLPRYSWITNPITHHRQDQWLEVVIQQHLDDENYCLIPLAFVEILRETLIILLHLLAKCLIQSLMISYAQDVYAHKN